MNRHCVKVNATNTKNRQQVHYLVTITSRRLLSRAFRQRMMKQMNIKSSSQRRQETPTAWVASDAIVDMTESNEQQAVEHDDERVNCRIFPRTKNHYDSRSIDQKNASWDDYYYNSYNIPSNKGGDNTHRVSNNSHQVQNSLTQHLDPKLIIEESRNRRQVKHSITDDNDSPTHSPDTKKQRILIDQHKMEQLLGLLRTDTFVGEIDPIYHSCYMQQHP